MRLTYEEEEAGGDEEQEQIREKTARKRILGGSHDGYTSLIINKPSLGIIMEYVSTKVWQVLIIHK